MALQTGLVSLLRKGRCSQVSRRSTLLLMLLQGKCCRGGLWLLWWPVGQGRSGKARLLLIVRQLMWHGGVSLSVVLLMKVSDVCGVCE